MEAERRAAHWRWVPIMLLVLLCLTLAVALGTAIGQRNAAREHAEQMADRHTRSLVALGRDSALLTGYPMAIRLEKAALTAANRDLKYQNQKLAGEPQATIMRLLDEKYFLDVQYDDNMQQWSGATGEAVEITMENAELWREEMERYYELLHDTLSEDKRHWLLESQTQWESFTLLNEELAWQAWDQVHHGGSFMRIHTATIYRDRYRDRTLYLMKVYNSLVWMPY